MMQGRPTGRLVEEGLGVVGGVIGGDHTGYWIGCEKYERAEFSVEWIST